MIKQGSYTRETFRQEIERLVDEMLGLAEDGAATFEEAEIVKGSISELDQIYGSGCWSLPEWYFYISSLDQEPD
jgi:hypothetical protein